MKKVLVACEESQAVCKAFRELGHEAYSCDIQECSGGHPEWHILGDVLQFLNPIRLTVANEYGILFATCDGKHHLIENKWDLIIAHPPCTYLTVTGNRWFNVERYGEKAKQRIIEREKAAEFFMSFVEYAEKNGVKMAIENPVGYMSTYYRKPVQIIQPYMFGDAERKATCLWLFGLPKLEPTEIVEPNVIKYKNGKGTDSAWHMGTMSLPKEERSRERSKTFLGTAKAMAEQWGDYINNIKEEHNEKTD